MNKLKTDYKYPCNLKCWLVHIINIAFIFMKKISLKKWILTSASYISQ